MIGLLCATPQELAIVPPLLTGAVDAASPRGTRLIRGKVADAKYWLFQPG